MTTFRYVCRLWNSPLEELSRWEEAGSVLLVAGFIATGCALYIDCLSLYFYLAGK